jgi:hypothetical protein
MGFLADLVTPMIRLSGMSSLNFAPSAVGALTPLSLRTGEIARSTYFSELTKPAQMTRFDASPLVT